MAKKLTLSLLLFCALPLLAQPVVTLVGPPTATPGQTIAATLSVAGTSTTGLGAIQFSLPAAPAACSFASVVPAGYACYCGPNGVCLGLNMSLTNWIDTMAVSLSLTIPANATGTVSFPLTGLIGASVDGNDVPLTAAPAYTVKIASKCDVNGDGVVNMSDVLMAVDGAISKSACKVSAGCSVRTVILIIKASSGSACAL